MRLSRAARLTSGLGVSILLACLAGCGPQGAPETPASAPDQPGSAGAAKAPAQRPSQSLIPQDVVKDRAQARWGRMMAGDFAGAYAFETPAYRGTIDLEQYIAQFGNAVRWLGATVDRVEIDPDGQRALVEITLDIQSQAPLGGGVASSVQPITEHWISDQGNWWLVHDEDGAE